MPSTQNSSDSVNNSINFSGSSASNVQIAQLRDGNVSQLQQVGTIDSAEQLQPSEVIALLEELSEILSSADIPKAQKDIAMRNVGSAMDVANEEEPDKDFGAKALKRVINLIKSAEETIDAGTGFVSKAKPVLEKLLPWFGLALTL